MNEEIQLSVLRALAISWREIGFEYDGLTDIEKDAISLHAFDQIVGIMQEKGLIAG